MNSSTLKSRRLTDEECRILIAVDEGRFSTNKHGRYVIDREERPDRRTRENLHKRGLIDDYLHREPGDSRLTGGTWKWRITAKGKAALDAEITLRVKERADV